MKAVSGEDSRAVHSEWSTGTDNQTMFIIGVLCSRTLYWGDT